MVGNSHEMLLHLSYNEDAAELLKLTPSRLRLLRHKISMHKVSEEYIISALVRLGCRCIRPRVVLPCIIKDSSGKIYDEYSFTHRFFSKELAKRYDVDYKSIMRHTELGHSINRPLLKHLLRSRKASIVLDNMVLDSVWSYEPIELNYTKDKVIQVRGMLATSLPISDCPYDILSYQLGHGTKRDYAWLTPLDSDVT